MNKKFRRLSKIVNEVKITRYSYLRVYQHRAASLTQAKKSSVLSRANPNAVSTWIHKS